MKRLLVITAVVLLAACAYKQRPIYNVDHPIPAAAAGLPLERIEALIQAAGAKRRWQMVRQGPGHLVATQEVPKHSATVDITFDRQSFRITYRDSTNLLENDGHIHAHYNFWVRNLEADIHDQLAAANRGA
jgi:hypothetical protein